MYSINVHLCYFTRIALTVILLCCFQCCSQDFGCSNGDTDSDGATRRLCESNLLLGWSLIGMYSINVHMCYFTRIALTVVLLCYFQGFSHYFGGCDAMATAMVRLVSFVSRIVGRMVAYRYV